MRITLAHNLRTENSESEAELLFQEDVDRIVEALSSLRHKVTPVEVSGRPDEIVERLLDSDPDLIFNVAEGTVGSSREAFYPGLYEQLGIPFTGGNASLLHMNLDKHLAKTVIASRGIHVPRGALVTPTDRELPAGLEYPLFIKPNSEGSSKGITQSSVVETPEACRRMIDALLPQYPTGLVVEEFISGRELSVPFLEALPGQVLEIVEHTFDLGALGSKYNVYDYEMKQGGDRAKAVGVRCPAVLTAEERRATVDMARKVFQVMSCPDFGRVDVRLREDGTPFFIELNPLPSLHPNASLMHAARARGLDAAEMFRLVIRSAARRSGIPLRRPRVVPVGGLRGGPTEQRPTVRECGIRVGRYQPGAHNAITDVKGVKVGHVTRVEDHVKLAGVTSDTTVRTGVTAVLPAARGIFKKRLVAGGFVLNGVGEMAGLTQVLEWGWLETPILLTNSLSVGRVHSGVVAHMLERNPQIGDEHDVILPVVGETDDSFLNDVRAGVNTAADARKAIALASSGAVVQGSVGAGTGMITCDFAGGVGTASRVLPDAEGGFTLGVLVLSNFGRMRNLTVEGAVVGRELDRLFPLESRRVNSYGSVIVVIATDAPLLSSQLNGCPVGRPSASAAWGPTLRRRAGRSSSPSARRTGPPPGPSSLESSSHSSSSRIPT